MFQTLADMATMRALLEAAERESAAMGEADPGAEHVVKAALTLPDRTADQALAELGVGAARLRAAIEQLPADALAAVGIAEPPTPSAGGGLGSGAARGPGQRPRQPRHAEGDPSRGAIDPPHILVVGTTIGTDGPVPRSPMDLPWRP